VLASDVVATRVLCDGAPPGRSAMEQQDQVTVGAMKEPMNE
jgi:hypothetical protein